MIKVKGLQKKFDQRGIAGLHGIDLELPRGKVLGVMGPNGSGKSTLLNLISAKISADSGSIELQGKFSFFPGDLPQKNMNVQKFLIQAVELDVSEDKKLQLTRDLADTFEFTFQLRQNLNELSSGQLQKVLLARELINRPSLLLLDEPFSHLDPVSRREILSALFSHLRQQEITVIWVTHDLQEAFRYSDLIGVLNFGKLVQMGPPETLIRRPQSLFVAQFMGYRNFLPIKKSADSWVTPWGQLDHDLEGEEALLVIPDHCWEPDETGLELIIQERFASAQAIEYLLAKDLNHFTWKCHPQEPLLGPGTQVKLKPVLTHCFFIPL